jgi:hypothetical protein
LRTSRHARMLRFVKRLYSENVYGFKAMDDRLRGSGEGWASALELRPMNRSF